MKNLLFSVFILISNFSVFAQYTDVINSNRPGISQGAFAVGKNVLQFELGTNLTSMFLTKQQ